MSSEDTRELDITEDESLRSLSDQLSDPCLKSSARVLILISLIMNKRLSFVQLLALTGLGKGSLENHIQKLETSGYLTSKNVKTFGGMREWVEITEKGLQVTKQLLETLRGVGHREPMEEKGSQHHDS
jgi:DNA-binding MarR family transcriptional regulator